ncbi:MAG: 16S rRNA (uracil1498-N3)-methyltransferase [Oceanicoccus sp.]|jgi:16S rRNA (uracil1498-N3)-methyltransferase
MRISRLFTDQPLSEQAQLTLNEATSHYLSKVLRLQEKAALILFNGQGGQFEATINSISKKQLTVDIGAYQRCDAESPLAIHLGIAVSKGDRMDMIMQKATELGVSSITPLSSERTEVKLKGERLEKKLQHWQKIVINACEQSGRDRVPPVKSLQPLTQWINDVHADEKLVLHHRAAQQLQADQQVSSVALLIGPEGGLSETEISSAESNNFNALKLGPRVLRTETAPLAAVTLLQYVWGDF